MTLTIALTIILGMITVWCGLASFSRDRDGTITRNHHTTGVWLICAAQYSYWTFSISQWPPTHIFWSVGGSLVLFVAVAWVKTYSLFPPRKKKDCSPQPEVTSPSMIERELLQQ